MRAVHIRLFGKVSIQRDGAPLPDLSAKALELLCYLLLYRDRPHTREALATLLWPDAAFSLSKKYLRQTLWQLQATLADHGDGGDNGDAAGSTDSHGVLVLNPGWIRADPKGAWWLDVEAFEHAYRLCRDTAGEDLSEPQAKTLEDAVLLYQGDLAEAWYQDWCIYERDRLQLTYLAMLEKLMRYCGARGTYAKGVAYGERILRHDPARESTHRHLMLLYYLAGDRTTALRQYERCASAMVREFDLQPSRETVELHQQVRADRVEAAVQRSAFGGRSAAEWRSSGDRRALVEPVHDVLLDLHQRLDQIQAGLSLVLSHMQHRSTPIGRVSNCD